MENVIKRKSIELDKSDLIEKAGSWYAYSGEKIGQGKDNAKVYFKQNPAKAIELEALIKEFATSTNALVMTADDDNESSRADEDSDTKVITELVE
jgi:recombination protein RecA